MRLSKALRAWVLSGLNAEDWPRVQEFGIAYEKARAALREEPAPEPCLNCNGTGFYMLDGARRPCLWDHPEEPALPPAGVRVWAWHVMDGTEASLPSGWTREEPALDVARLTDALRAIHGEIVPLPNRAPVSEVRGHHRAVVRQRRERVSSRMTAKQRRRAVRDARGPVVAECLSCKWTATARTWRPAKRALAEHTSKAHRG